MRASIFQSDTAGLTPAERLVRLQAAAQSARADLMVCPELFASGYATRKDIERHAEPVDGQFSAAVTRIARATRTAIVYGYPECHDGLLYNAAQCIDASGRAVANHRKLALPPGFESDIFTAGAGLTLFNLNGLLMGLLICYEAEFPEAVRATELAGAQVILVPTALSSQWKVVAHRLIPTRAFENGVYLLYANHSGTEAEINYLGASAVIGPDGQDLVRADEVDAIIGATLDEALVVAAQRRLPYLADVIDLRSRIVADVSSSTECPERSGERGSSRTASKTLSSSSNSDRKA